VQVAVETVNRLIVTHEVTIYSSVAEGENHVRLVTALKSGRLSGEWDLECGSVASDRSRIANCYLKEIC
jgi:hypothetical protein